MPRKYSVPVGVVCVPSDHCKSRGSFMFTLIRNLIVVNELMRSFRLFCVNDSRFSIFVCQYTQNIYNKLFLHFVHLCLVSIA